MLGHQIKQTMRRAGLLGLAAIAVHQLRYLVGYGSGAREALAQQGHGYLASAMPELAGGAVLLVGASIAAATVARSAMAENRSLRSDWMRSSLSLLAIFCAQELTEGSLRAGHPGGPTALVSARGWLVPFLVLAFGAIVALAMRVLRSADAVFAVRRRRPRQRRAPLRFRAPTIPDVAPAAGAALAFGFARRPPPELLLPA